MRPTPFSPKRTAIAYGRVFIIDDNRSMKSRSNPITITSKTQTTHRLPYGSTLLSVTDDGGATTDGSSSSCDSRRNRQKKSHRFAPSLSAARGNSCEMSRTQISCQPALPPLVHRTLLSVTFHTKTTEGRDTRQGQTAGCQKRIPVNSN